MTSNKTHRRPVFCVVAPPCAIVKEIIKKRASPLILGIALFAIQNLAYRALGQGRGATMLFAYLVFLSASLNRCCAPTIFLLFLCCLVLAQRLQLPLFLQVVSYSLTPRYCFRFSLPLFIAFSNPILQHLQTINSSRYPSKKWAASKKIIPC